MLDNRLTKEENHQLTGENIYDIHEVFENTADALKIMSKKNPDRSIYDILNDIKKGRLYLSKHKGQLEI